jgi:hypothetical protein
MGQLDSNVQSPTAGSELLGDGFSDEGLWGFLSRSLSYPIAAIAAV